MPIEIAGIIALALSIMALHRGQDVAVRTFVPSTLFGAAAAVNAPGVGSIQPAQFLLATLGLAVFADTATLRRSLRSLRFPAPGFWLLCTWAYGVLGAIFMPRLLGAAFVVNAIGSSSYGNVEGQIPFGPTTGNMSQSIYFTGDLVCFLACLAVAGTPRGFRSVSIALMAYCAGDIVLALLDLGTYYTGTSGILDFIRNAKYTIYVDTDESSAKRIIGSFTEASAFASATLGVLGFCARSWLEDLRPRLSLALAVAAFTLLLLSTSSTAYVGVAICAALLVGHGTWAIVRGRASRRHLAVTVLGPLLVGCCTFAILLHPQASQALGDLLESAILNKSTSQSGIDRGLLNVTALQNLFDTGGFGTGIGGVRTSSFVLAVLANLGIIGGATYAAFIGTALAGAVRPGTSETVRRTQAAARTACVWLLVSASISGALVDLGLPFFIFAALACARPDAETRRRFGADGRPGGGESQLYPASVPAEPTRVYRQDVPEARNAWRRS